MCDCIQELNKKLSEQMGVEGGIVNVLLFSKKTFSTFGYEQGKRNKSLTILHSYCPFCGEKYYGKGEVE